MFYIKVYFIIYFQSQTNSGSRLKHCSVTVSRNPADTSNLPESLINKVLKRASKCLTLQFCEELGEISNDKVTQ